MDSIADLEPQLTGDEPSNEIQVYGPPGCGKTTYLGRQVSRAVEKYGDNIMLTSFSKAAAVELAGRDLPVDKERIGTLHAHCYRALGNPKIAEGHTDEWNELYPAWKVAKTRDNALDEDPESRSGGSATGEELLRAVNRHRNLNTPYEKWPAEALQFYVEWRKWRDRSGYMDFTQLLEQAALHIKIAPGDPAIIFADEAQDLTPLQLRIVRQWGRYANFFVLVGDDDQCIYNFTGASPGALLHPPVPPFDRVVLKQSWRVPIVVHAQAVDLIRRMLASDRMEKVYLPTQIVGEVRRLRESFDDGDRLADMAEEEAARGHTTMFLATCAYMLIPLRAALVERGIPFHNPYRLKRGDWNPLRAGRGVSAAARVLSFLRPHQGAPWTGQDAKRWAEWMKADSAFLPGVKAGIAQLADDRIVHAEQLAEWLQPEAFESLLAGVIEGSTSEHLEWWLSRVLADHKKTAAYPCRIVQRRGAQALIDPPKIILGTIHSVKGGEADAVYLCPDLSGAGHQQRIASWDGHDALVRLMYVGMTRARHKLALCSPSYRSGPQYFQF